MTLKQDDMEILERKLAMYVLLAIDKKPMSTKTEIMRLHPNNERTKFVRMQELIEAGYIEYKADDKGIDKLVLTKEGQEAANRIKKLRLVVLGLRNNRAGVAGDPEPDDVTEDS